LKIVKSDVPFEPVEKEMKLPKREPSGNRRLLPNSNVKHERDDSPRRSKSSELLPARGREAVGRGDTESRRELEELEISLVRLFDLRGPASVSHAELVSL
jgi:hypothetical protein